MSIRTTSGILTAPVVGDGQILQQLGANALRAYHHLYNKRIFREMFKKHGIRILAGDMLGMYTLGSNAKWEQGTDYSNAMHRRTMLRSVRKMVQQYKDEPYVIMWVLGHENLYGGHTNANERPDVFFDFVETYHEFSKRLILLGP